MKNRGLGKGLDALFSESSYQLDENDGGISTLRISDIEPDRKQPRKNFDMESLTSLADSISHHGVLQPIVVRKIVHGSSDAGISKVLKSKYSIVAGERRWRAAKMAGLSEVPVIIREFDDREAAAIMLVENLQREDLNAVEQSRGLKRLIDEFELTHEQTAQAVGMSRPALTNALRLLSLPKDTLASLEAGDISAGHARALLSLSDEKKIDECTKTIIAKGLSVRDTEKLVKDAASNAKKKPGTKKDPSKDAYMEKIEKAVSSSLGRKSKIVSGKGGNGKLEIEYYGNDDLEALIKTLCGKNIFKEI